VFFSEIFISIIWLALWVVFSFTNNGQFCDKTTQFIAYLLSSISISKIPPTIGFIFKKNINTIVSVSEKIIN